MAQEQVKISQLPQQSTPTTSDKVPVVSGGVTNYELLSSLILLFFNNIPAGTIPGSVFDYVISGGVWSGDAYASTRNASMTEMSVYINNRTIAVNAVVARSFTASKDTYVDLLDNLDGTGTLVYTEVTNNAASPALAANSMRIAIIITGASNIANVGSVNQGQEDKVLPIASSIPYTVTDSLGNLICPRDPNRRTLGYKQIISSFTNATSASDVDVTGLAVTFIVPTGRKVEVILGGPGYEQSGGIGTVYGVLKVKESSTVLGTTGVTPSTANFPNGYTAIISPSSVSAGLHTYKMAVANNSTGPNFTIGAASTSPAYVLVRLA